MTTTYTLTGSVRGNCGHNHRTIEAAAECCLRDQRDCNRAGGYSDRNLRVIEDGETREPNESEYLAICDRIDKAKNPV